jgi:hypothetical protein
MSGFSKVKTSIIRLCSFAICLADGLICWYLYRKELKRLSILPKIFNKYTSYQLLRISDHQVKRLFNKYKSQGTAASAHASRAQSSHYKLTEELRLKCFNMLILITV